MSRLQIKPPMSNLLNNTSVNLLLQISKQWCRSSLYVLNIIFLAPLFFIPNQIQANEVAAVKSADIQPYNRAINGFKKIVPSKVRQYLLKRNQASGKEETLLLIENKQTKLIFALGSDALDFAQTEYRDIPVLFSFVLNPEQAMGTDWMQSRTNLHGISMNIPPAAQFEILKLATPSIKRIGVVYDPLKTKKLIAEAKKAAAALGMTLITKAISLRTEAINAVDSMKGEVDAIWMVPDTTAITMESIKYTLLFSFRNRLPLIGISEKYVKIGALFALSFDSEKIGQQAGKIAIQILNDTSQSNSSYVEPKELKLTINVKTAKKIGLTIPSKLLESADKLY